MRNRIRELLSVILLVCLVFTVTIASLAESPVTYLLPIDYFCMDETQTESTQEQLDEYSRDGLLYEFTGDGQILCTVVDQEAALSAVLAAMEADFAEAMDTEYSMYIKSFRELRYSADLSEITIVCCRDEWGFMDSLYSMIFIGHANDYQQICGIPEADRKCELAFVDEDGEVIETDSLSAYLDTEAE